MSPRPHYIYVDRNDYTINVECSGQCTWDKGHLRQSLWTIDAVDDVDALRLSVSEGHVDDVIVETEKTLQRHQDYIAKNGSNIFDPIVPAKQQEAAETQKLLAAFMSWKDAYQTPVMQTPLFRKRELVA